MRRFLTLAFALLALTACAPTGGLLVSEDARDLGGNLFIETTATGDNFLVLDGEISPQTSFVFQSVVEQSNVEGLVIVTCVSACVDIFVAGRNREMTVIAELGLHSATNRDVSYEIDRRYWSEMGFPLINEKAYRVPNNRLWIMDAKRARELRVATNIIR